MTDYIRSIWLLAAAIACYSASADPRSIPAAVAEVTQFEKHLEEFYNSPEFARNPERGLQYYDKDLRFFDIMQPMEYRGEQFKEHFIALGKQFEGGKVEFLELEVTAGPNMACATSLQHFAGKTPDGKPYDMTMRVTDFLEKKRAHWIITHEHVSLPLDPATFLSVINPNP